MANSRGFGFKTLVLMAMGFDLMGGSVYLMLRCLGLQSTLAIGDLYNS